MFQRQRKFSAYLFGYPGLVKFPDFPEKLPPQPVDRANVIDVLNLQYVLLEFRKTISVQMLGFIVKMILVETEVLST